MESSSSDTTENSVEEAKEEVTVNATEENPEDVDMEEKGLTHKKVTTTLGD